jgi:hypothetical protein
MPAPVQALIKKGGKYKLDPDSLKAAFNAKTIEERPKVKALVERIRDVIRDGINRNRRDYRLFKAMDWAYDSPFYQVSYTQLRGLLSNKPDDKKVMETVRQWGLTHLLSDVLDSSGKPCCDATTGLPKKSINLPVFFNIFIPIAMSYTTIRWAKLFNDRNLVPLYKYEPVQFTKENRLRCEVITQIVQRQSAWFGYPADLRQSILQTLLYGFCINFPREAWYSEKQDDGTGTEKVIREGLRFDMPHPSRIYYDLYHRLSTLNTNSGCEYAGHWMLRRYKDIHDCPLYWNKDLISMGSVGWFDVKSDFLEEVFPCQMTFPENISDGLGGAGALDRQTEAYRSYGQGDFNTATLVTEHFQKIIPSENGLGTYEHPVWFRFVMASDNAVIWAEPLAFDRLPVYAFDADFNRARFRSLVLEIMPFQDHVGNLMTQWIAAVKENLINPIFVDKEKMPAEALSQLQNLGYKNFGGRQFFPFSSTENYRFKVDQREAFYSPQLTRHNTQEIAATIEGVLNMLDRVMQLSPQEIGQAASHEQTAEETKVISQNTSTRVTFTGSFIDDGDYAKKVMLYDAMMAYADDDITVGISSSFASTEEELKKLMTKVGLTIQDDSTYDPNDPDSMRTVKAKKSALQMESFASTRDASERIDNPAIADAMSKMFLAVANNPVLIQSIGAVQLVELLNQIIVTAGLPKEFRLKGKNVDPAAQPEQQAEQVNQMISQFAEQVKQAIEQSQQQTLQAAAQQTQQLVGEAVGQVAQQIAPMAEAIAQGNQINQVQQAEIEKIKQMMAQVAQAVAKTAQATQNVIAPPQPQMAPMSPAPGIGVPV